MCLSVPGAQRAISWCTCLGLNSLVVRVGLGISYIWPSETKIVIFPRFFNDLLFLFCFLRPGWGHHASFGGHVGSFKGPFFVLGGVYASVAPLPKSFKTPRKNEVFDESRFPASWTFGACT